jgi:hypothetical protein
MFFIGKKNIELSHFCSNFMLPREIALYISLKSQNVGLKQTSVRMTPHAGSTAEKQGQHVDFRSC